ncbi:response regulator, partial [Paenibacillus sp. OT2-17]
MSKPRVLVVDDENAIRKLIKTVLEGDGMVVLQAENGMEAMRMISEEPFDLVLLDIMMENIDGYDV